LSEDEIYMENLFRKLSDDKIRDLYENKNKKFNSNIALILENEYKHRGLSSILDSDFTIENTTSNNSSESDTSKCIYDKVQDSTSFKETILNILRYVLTLPCAFLGCILGTLIVPYVFTAYFAPDSLIYNITFYIISNVFFVLAPLAILYYMPPRKFPKTIYTIGIIYSVFWVFTIIAEIIFGAFSLRDLGNAVIQIATIIYFIFTVSNDNT